VPVSSIIDSGEQQMCNFLPLSEEASRHFLRHWRDLCSGNDFLMQKVLPTSNLDLIIYLGGEGSHRTEKIQVKDRLKDLQVKVLLLCSEEDD